MSLDEKLTALAHVYRVLDGTQKDENPFCHRGCSACCTLNVAMTTLEGYQLIRHLTQTKQMDLLNRLPHLANQLRYKPTMTINTLAKRCAENDEGYEEPCSSSAGVCPLLTDDICSVYEARPVACRIMLSRQDCRANGYADMDPFFLTVSDVMMQFSEHIDQGGLTGNLIDVLGYLADEEKRSTYKTATALNGIDGLLPNHPLTVLMIPPQHRQSIAPVLKALNPSMGDIF